MVKFGYQQSWFYAMEDTIKVPTTNVPLRLPGFITGETKIDAKVNLHEFRSLKQPTDTDMRLVDSIQTSKSDYSWSITYVPLKRSSSPKYDFRHFHNCAMNNTSSTSTGGAWTYGTSIVTNLRSFTVYKIVDNLNHQLNGCYINRLSMKGSLDMPVEIMVDGQASGATFTSLSMTAASSLTGGTPFMWSDVRIYLDGTLATGCTAFEYSIHNNTSPYYVLGNKEPNRVSLGGRDIEVSVTRQYNDQAEYAIMKNNTPKSITVQLADSSNVTIGIRNVKYEQHPIPGDSDPKMILLYTLRGKAQSIFTN